MTSVTQVQFQKFIEDERVHHERQEGDIHAIQEKLISIEATQDKHSHTIYGNDKIGMDEQVRELYKYMLEQKGREEADDKERRQARLAMRNQIVFIFVTQIVLWGVNFFFSK